MPFRDRPGSDADFAEALEAFPESESEIRAAEIVDDLQAALEAFEAIQAELESAEATEGQEVASSA